MTAFRKAAEAYFHSKDDVARYIDQAVHIVTEAELTDDLMVPAFIKAVELLAQKQVAFEQVGATGVLLGQPNHRPL